MDPNKHHDYIGGTEELPNAPYFNRDSSARPQPQYYTQDRAMNNIKSCRCSHGNVDCNECVTRAERKLDWESMQKTEFKNLETRNFPKQNHRYMHSNITDGFSWQRGPNDVLPANDAVRPEENALNKSSMYDANYNYKTQLAQQHQRSNTSEPFYKQRSYENKYPSAEESLISTKIGCSNSSHGTTLYDLDSASVGNMRMLKTDQHIINPSNILTSKEQQQSPNYARKCPQIFSSEEQNLGSGYSNLYMSTPQFSSDKFSGFHAQQNVSRIEPRSLSNIVRVSHLHPEASKCRERLNHSSSSMPGFSTSTSNKYNQRIEHTNPHVTEHLTNYSCSTSPPGNMGHYSDSHTKVHAPEMSPIIMKQNHAYYQYSKRSLPSSPSHVASATIPPQEVIEYVKRGDPYDTHGFPNTRNLYVNPYNTPPSSDNCCKDSSSPYSVASTYHDESPHQSVQKCSRLIQETIKTNQSGLVNQNTPPTSRLANFGSHSAYYYETQNKFDVQHHHSASSPATATVASPPVPPLSTSQTQMHHIDYSSRTHQPSHAYHLEHQLNVSHQSASSDNGILTHRNDHPYEVQIQHVQQNSKIAYLNAGGKIKSVGVVSTAPLPPMQQPPKKSQIVKPNYRELINQVYAMRSTTSEEELNLQIIKKTLKVDPQVIRPVNAPFENNLPLQSLSSVDATPAQSSFVRHAQKHEIIPTAAYGKQKTSANCKVKEIRQTVNHEEKTSSASPLDLSIRTVKTKADSTECKYRLAPTTFAQSVDCKYTLPRVDFTPNFALNAAECNVITKPLLAPSYSKKVEQINQKQPAQSLPGSVQNHAVVYTKFDQRNTHFIATSPITQENKYVPSVTTETAVIKPLERNCISEAVQQIRPSVLETNPYATAKVAAVKLEPQLTNMDILAIEEIPPEASALPLPKPHFESSPQPVIKAVEQPSIPNVPEQSAYRLACERNPNFLGRKRHLHEYSHLKYNSEPANKQPRYSEPAVAPKVEYSSKGEIAVITTIKKADKPIPAEVPCYQKSNSVIVENTDSKIMCKKEILTSNSTEPLPVTAIKTETNYLMAARIRTKAELKGFTFNSPIVNTLSLPQQETRQIKEEYSPSTNIETSSILELPEEFSQDTLVDFSWNNTCNNFVEQLLTNPKKIVTLTRKESLINVKTEVSDDDLPVATIALKKQFTTEIADKVSCRDNFADYPIGDINISNMESAEANASMGRSETNESAMAVKPLKSDRANMPKKVNKMDREKLRLQQEKRIAARRLQAGSSSETDNELDKRKSERLKKPLKKNKLRNSVFTDKNRFSECGSDSSSDSGDNSLTLKHVNTVNVKKENIANSTQSSISYDIEQNSSITCTAKQESSGLNKQSTLSTKNVKHPKELQLKDVSRKKNNVIEDVKSNSEGDFKTAELRKAKGSKVQCSDTSNKVKTDKSQRKTKLLTKLSLNTMTRSKRKRELELQLANSKVLRNDKVIRNSMTKIKRKYERKFVNNKSCCLESLVADKKEVSEGMPTRLRSKNEKRTAKFGQADDSKNIKQNKVGKNRSKLRKLISSPLARKRERQTDLLLEEYRYKRSLKIPPSLITLKDPSNQKIAASLPDIERSAELSTTSDRPKKKNTSTNTNTCDFKKSTSLSTEHRSFIDLLHSRVTSTSVRSKSSKEGKPAYNNNNGSLTMHSETSQNTESFSAIELLQCRRKENDSTVESNGGKKRHFSIFETKVLQTKTRTESKMQQKKEIIREIFVGDDRPASAPPEMTQSSSGDKMTYEQKYEQFLQQMNVVINEDRLKRFNKSETISLTPPGAIKQEDDTESTSAIDADEKHDVENQQDNISINSSCTPSSFRRRRPGKYLRRKGSSGFDYIRKKKKPAAAGTASNLNHIQVKNDRTEGDHGGKAKTENDVSRELQKWVLNKGVGQSTIHKAARQGYIDVVVYCLDRMSMNPDQKDNAGYTPLHEACTNGWLDIARILLQYGANHSEAAHSGIRPLHEASENDHEEIVRLLLAYGADPLLATYSGQTPLMLASSTTMRNILNNHLSDVQSIGCDRMPWRFNGPWDIYDASKLGFDIFGGAPNVTCDMSRALRKSSVSTLIASKKQLSQHEEHANSLTIMDKCAVVLDNIDRFNTVRLYNDNKQEFLVENSDSEGEIFEFEEADILLPPLYLLKDEGVDKWVLLNDLCNLLKVKSKDTLLNKICPPSSSVSSEQKNLVRELKMSDFLEKATCLQLLCAGEKINICASKVVLIKYNESVKKLLGVKTILMKF